MPARAPPQPTLCLVLAPSARPASPPRCGARPPRAAAGADTEPGEVVVASRAGRPRPRRGRAAARRRSVAGASRRPRRPRGCARGRDVRYAVPNSARIARRRAPSRSSPTTPAAGSAGGWQATQWNFVGPFGVNAPDAWANADRRRPPRRPRRHGRGARHRRRLRATAAATGARPTSRARSSSRATTSSTTTPTRSTATATARTSPATIARGDEQRHRADRPRLRRARSCRCACSTAGEGDAVDDRARHPLRRPPRRPGDQPQPRVRHRRHAPPRSRDCSTRSPTRTRRGASSSRASGNEAGGDGRLPGARRDVISVGATTEHGCLSDFSNDGSGLDLVAPGGGARRAIPGDPNCQPDAARRAATSSR